MRNQTFVWLNIILVLTLLLPGASVNAQREPEQSQRSRSINSSPNSNQKQKPSQAESEPEAEVVRVDTNLVNTLFTAVDKDQHFITSLQAGDVRVFENDIPQPVSVFERETDRPLSLAIMVDTSESQRGVLQHEKSAARAFIDQMIRPNIDRASIVSFTGVPKVEQQLTNDLVKLRQGIDRVRIELSPANQWRLANDLDPLPKDEDPSGYTGIWDAMWETIEEQLAKSTGQSRRSIILLSDGDDTSSTIKRENVIDLAVKNDVVVYSIGIRDPEFPEGKLDSGALKKISNRTGGRAFFPRNSAELQSVFRLIEEELRSQYLVGYSPTNANKDGTYRRIRLEVVNPQLRKDKVLLLYRQGYYARKN